MDTSRFLLTADEFALPFSAPPAEFALIDLDSTGADIQICLPSYPLIGVGSPDHPAASQLDTVVESPVSADAIARRILSAPNAASVAVQLTRRMAELVDADALLVESLAYGMLQGGGEHERWLSGDRKRGFAAPGALAVNRQEDILVLEFDRPAALNAIDRSMRDQLRDGFITALLDPTIRTIRLSGRGRAFSVGADLTEFGTTRDPPHAHMIRMQTLAAPVIAACADKLEVRVHGPCIGAGLEIAAFARRLTATHSSWFQLPELAMGLIPGAGGSLSLSRRIGRHRTNLMILSGRRIGAGTAFQWGLVDTLIDD